MPVSTKRGTAPVGGNGSWAERDTPEESPIRRSLERAAGKRRRPPGMDEWNLFKVAQRC
ncbi:hypothetical protein KIPB_004754, partial [Kipferlia bialata]|eukprot:g4754.t1